MRLGTELFKQRRPNEHIFGFIFSENERSVFSINISPAFTYKSAQHIKRPPHSGFSVQSGLKKEGTQATLSGFQTRTALYNFDQFIMTSYTNN